MHSRWKTQGTLVLGLIICLVAIREVSATQAAQAGGQAAGYVGQATCLTCHADLGKIYSETPHGRATDPRTPAAKQGCESCHGPGKAHVDGGGDKTKIRSFAVDR